ncbi:hypothetical protein SS50377_27532 [Spironucleus salmonicida]|uniref:Uncharacterized protein n=1 Tax=Spironucleus salmonicida TaxID=348837 RepID=V6LT56_9EUKA|nr:hypothetical protein SS50377_27532 [Spironucleus salmonicida]|eukprot:EST46876.1 Hypothetical protein SS50377_13028 [Spironucleus salmonicida]
MEIQLSSKLRFNPLLQYLTLPYTFHDQPFDIQLSSKVVATTLNIMLRTAQQIMQNQHEILPLLKQENTLLIATYTPQTAVFIDEITLLYSNFSSQIPSFSPQNTAQILLSFARYFANTDAIFSLNSAKGLSVSAGNCAKTLLNERQARNFAGKSLSDLAKMSIDELEKLSFMSFLSGKEVGRKLDCVGGSGEG